LPIAAAHARPTPAQVHAGAPVAAPPCAPAAFSRTGGRHLIVPLSSLRTRPKAHIYGAQQKPIEMAACQDSPGSLSSPFGSSQNPGHQ
jgi:hypothetical protein